MSNVLTFEREPEVPCDACGATEFIGSNINLKAQDTGEERGYMLCSNCALAHVKRLFDFLALYTDQLERNQLKTDHPK